MKLKKIKSILFIFAMMFILSACVNEKVSESDDEVIASAEESEEVAKPAIKQKKTTYEDGSYDIAEYDIDGKLLEEKGYLQTGTLKYTTTMTYDDNGNLCMEESRETDGEVRWIRKYDYDKDGNLIREYHNNWEFKENLELVYEYKYKKGKKIQWIYYSDPGKIFDIHNYEYDGDLLIRESKDSDDGYNYRTWEYEYYDDGTLAKMTDIYYGRIREVEYYDSEERIVKEELYSEDGNISQWTEYMYGEDFTEIISFDDDGSIYAHSKTIYKNSLPVSNVNIDEKGNEGENWHCDYDENGNKIYSYSFAHSFLGEKTYEYTAEYNEYGYPTMIHDVCSDPIRNAGMYDELMTYEYVYY